MPSALPATPPAVLLLHDGAAGNRRQVTALAAALGLPTNDTPLAARAPWAWTAPRRWPGDRHAFGPAFTDLLDAPPVLAFGCGRQAALATRLLRERGTRVVQVLDPRLPPRHWDWVIAPQHDGLRGTNVLHLHGSLNPVDAAWCQRARGEHAELLGDPAPRTAFLLGGPTAACRWRRRDLEIALERLLAEHPAGQGSLWVCASRRTPPALALMLRQALAGRGRLWTGPADGANPYPGFLAGAERLVVSADSANLLSEAASTTAALCIAFPERATGRIGRLIQHALSCGRARALTSGWDENPARPWQETARVAARLRQVLDLPSPPTA